MDDNQLLEISRKLESISNHQDFFKKKLIVLDKIESALLGNEYNKKGIIPLFEEHEKRLKLLEENLLLNSEAIKEDSKKINSWDKSIIAIVIGVIIFELTKQIIR